MEKAIVVPRWLLLLLAFLLLAGGGLLVRMALENQTASSWGLTESVGTPSPEVVTPGGGPSQNPSQTADAAPPEPSPTPPPIPVTHALQGSVTAKDLTGGLSVLVGGYPGQPFTDFGMSDLNKIENYIGRIEDGETFPCPDGVGGGYEDLHQGAQVVIANGQGETLATTELTGGSLGDQGCTFKFEVTVPDADFYEVKVTQRGSLTYSSQELAAQDWKVKIAV